MQHHAVVRPPRLPAPLVALCCALWLAGCATTPADLPPSEARAQQLTARGDLAAAALVYEQLAAANPPPVGTDFALAALRAWRDAGRPAEGLRVVTSLAEPTLPAQQLALRMLHAELLLAAGRSTEAWTRLTLAPEPRPASTAFLALRQRLALAAQRPADAVRSGMALQQALTSDSERDQARRELLASLREAATRGTRLEAAAQRDATVRGWLELGQLAASAPRNPLAAAREVERWRGRNANHPAIGIAMGEILQAGRPAGSRETAGAAPAALAPGQSLALLLPLTGRQSSAAAMIRDGFMAGLAGLPADLRPTVRLHDTGSEGVAGALAAAQAEGVQFIVGPLTREEVVEAAARAPLSSPLLLLNALPGETGGPAGTWQFALSPEDEARQVAEQALSLGRRRALLIAPSGDWGNRVAGAFRARFQEGGGTVISSSLYDAAHSDFESLVAAALRVEESRQRHKQLEKLTGGRLVTELRPRGDIDLVFAAGQPVALRQIRPMLRFFGGSNIPTYMTSEGFDPDPTANRDIDGVIFPDSPWMLHEAGSVAEVRLSTQAQWANKGARLPRLFAFGYDAAQLALALRDPRWPWPLAGVTGTLSPDDAQRKVRRELDWAQIRNGKPLPLLQATAPGGG
ncbi:MAG: hypothetical protein RL026_496 [Pseudomonadota bacterium]|jgi:outer membrane PBP1 activator LpoA protein